MNIEDSEQSKNHARVGERTASFSAAFARRSSVAYKKLYPRATYAGTRQEVDVTADKQEAKKEPGLSEQTRREKERRWLEENKEAIEAENEYVEKHGLPLARHRTF